MQVDVINRAPEGLNLWDRAYEARTEIGLVVGLVALWCFSIAFAMKIESYGREQRSRHYGRPLERIDSAEVMGITMFTWTLSSVLITHIYRRLVRT